mgnify:CR=1 FL=1
MHLISYGTLFLLLGLCSACQFSDKPLFTALPADESGITFSNRITDSDTMNILDFEYVYNGGGVAIGDFNNDGWQDVFFTGNQVANRLYVNQGKDLRFSDVTQTAGVGGNGKWCSGVALVDINNDGWLDIYVGATVSKVAQKRENMLFVNQGGKPGGVPVFREMAKEYGIADDGHTTNAAFFDYDNDGDLDLYVLTNTIEQYPNAYRPKKTDGTSPTTDRLYRNMTVERAGNAGVAGIAGNRGDRRASAPASRATPATPSPLFVDVSREAGIQIEGYGLGLNIVDINRDGWKDIYVTNDYLSDDLLYINNQNGAGRHAGFTNRAQDFFKHTSSSAMGNDVADINNDGRVDMVAVDMLPRDNVRKKMLVGPNNYQTYLNNDEFKYGYQFVRNTLQLNQGFRPGTNEPIFSDVSLLADVAETDWSWTPSLADFDHDGYRDLLITNGFPRDITDRDFMSFRANSSSVASKQFMLDQIPVIKISNYAFRNNGNLTFSDATQDWGLNTPSFSNGAAFGDLDNDGDLDYVVNNINDSAFVYRNNLRELRPEKSNFLRVKFNGPEFNRSGQGAFVEILYGDNQRQVHEHTIYRGYLSTVENFAHFGLDTVQQVREVRIIWPGRSGAPGLNGQPARMQTLRNVKANQVLTVDVRQATDIWPGQPPAPAGRLFRDVTDSLKAGFVHQEPEYIDFNVQKLLPHKLSQYAPAIAVGDVNGDGLDDMVVGGSRTSPGVVMLQNRTGGFTQKPLPGGPSPSAPAPSLPAIPATPASKPEEDMGTLLFDADRDGDLDLYIASGGFEGEPNTPTFQDRLLVNDGAGNFQLSPAALPKNYTSKSCVKAADFDRDGDLDLFVGGRVVPGQYPRPASSLILRNDSQSGQPKFTDVTPRLAKDLTNIGLVCDALWTDYDNDGWMDLLLAGEWMPLTLLKNVKGTFQLPAEQPLASAVGWWNSLAGADFDGDGDTDYIAGNLGQNSLNRATDNEPIAIYAKDFDNNGFYDAIPTVFLPDGNGQRREFPFHGREDLIKQMIAMRARFPYYKDFASASVDKLLKEEELKDAIILKANYLKTAYLENRSTGGEASFILHELPVEAQLAPVFGMIADDFDQDGRADVLLVGNDYGNEVSIGRLDALDGLLLLGNGKGGFRALQPEASGFYVPGNAKGLARLTAADGTPLIVATQNRGPIRIFRSTRPARTVRLKPTDSAALLTYSDGRKQKMEVPYGQSFLSQTSRELYLSPGVKSVEIVDFRGQKRRLF